MQTTVRGIANQASIDKTDRFGNLFGLLTVVFSDGVLAIRQFTGGGGCRPADGAWVCGEPVGQSDGTGGDGQSGILAVQRQVLRQTIPKLNGKLRPLGIPAIADQVLQMAVTKILEAIYEADFLPCRKA
ncbi:MAG: hypothetical protein ACRERU_02685 [Methylococcales bacterium]